jgi:hypothetical protein
MVWQRWITSNEIFAINSPILLVREKVIWSSLHSVYVWKRKWGLILTKKTFRYRLLVSPPRKRTKTSSSTPNLKSPSTRTPSLLKKDLSISKYLYPFKYQSPFPLSLESWHLLKVDRVFISFMFKSVNLSICRKQLTNLANRPTKKMTKIVTLLHF